ncbi:methyltransferase domain-containing protein [Longimycelium tulufanense]|uniref:methyltransferase domain-containing protein n=1 Tax=Longimycelium tulufanense TaxID=907463 RepID=UPI00166EE928|nr:methyltransferase domain-containing protein [Longimycelium tulufanense]
MGLAQVGRPVRRLLDVSCGGGDLLAEAARIVPEVVGVDPVAVAVAAARQRLTGGPRCRVDELSMEQLADPAGQTLGTFDLAIMHLVFGLVENPLAGLLAVADRLSEGGLFYATDLLRPAAFNADPHVAVAFRPANSDEHAYLVDQVAASFSWDELIALGQAVERCAPVRVEVRAGGLGGFDIASGQARRLVAARAQHMIPLLRRFEDDGAPEGAGPPPYEVMWHLYLRRLT